MDKCYLICASAVGYVRLVLGINENIETSKICLATFVIWDKILSTELELNVVQFSLMKKKV